MNHRVHPTFYCHLEIKLAGACLKMMLMSSLASHPIFQTESDELKGFNATDRRNVVAFKGTEVYIAVGSTIRYGELREWYAKDNHSDNMNYYQVGPHSTF